MGKPRLELVAEPFDIAFEAMRDNDMACKACGGDCARLLKDAEVAEFMAGLDDLLVDEVADADVEVLAG